MNREYATSWACWDGAYDGPDLSRCRVCGLTYVRHRQVLRVYEPRPDPQLAVANGPFVPLDPCSPRRARL